MQTDVLLKAVADKTRLKILAYLTEGPKFVEQVAMQLNISVSTASFHLEKLKAARLVCDKKEQYYKTFTLNEGVLKTSLFDIVLSCKNEAKDEFKESVLKEYSPREKLNKLPVQSLKRKVLFAEIAAGLKKGRAYTERQINIYLADHYDDFVTMRKEMLAFGILSEENGVYHRK